MSILVTGATGNVGRIPFEYLGQKHDVIGISSQKEGNGIIKFDLANANESQISELLEKYKVDSVVHFAAILKMVTIPDRAFTSSAIEKFLSNPSGKSLKYVVIGSVAEYGPQEEGTKIDENTPTNPTTEYGKAKLEQTLLCEKYRNQGMDITVLRLLNVIAPHLPPGPFVGSVFDALRKGPEGVININNRDIERDLLDMRDFSYLIEKILHSPKKDFIYNVGSGRNISYGEFIDLCFSMIPPENRPHVNVIGNPEPLNQTLAVIDKVKNDFNWKPEHTLEDSLKWCLEENNIIESQKV